MKLIFERSVPGRGQTLVPPCDVPAYSLRAPLRADAPRLPEISEIDMSRHYTALAKRAHGVNSGFYPLGSCTMKYNPAVNEIASRLFSDIHPLQERADGCRELMQALTQSLCEITGMDGMTLSPAAGAHGELTGLMLIKAYHLSRGDEKRIKIIVPDSAHGTNPASAAMVGYQVVSIPSAEDGCVDLNALKGALDEHVAGLMLTNPNTVGLFDKSILEITRLVHEAGGLNYYDGANLNAVMGVARPGDMGFDVVHLNLHKTFSTPHGGGGPGSGPVGCKEQLVRFLPHSTLGESASDDSIGQVRAFYGNFGVAVKAYAYILSLGAEGLREASETAVLNANYLMHRLKTCYDVAIDHVCMHEFVLSLESLKEKTGVSAMDVAKAMLDRGMHPPTMYFPLIVHEALMFEPTETESRETLDMAADEVLAIYSAAVSDPASVQMCPVTTVISRPDEVLAARKPIVKYAFADGANV